MFVLPAVDIGYVCAVGMSKAHKLLRKVYEKCTYSVKTKTVYKRVVVSSYLNKRILLVLILV